MKLRPGGRQHNFPGICQRASPTQAAVELSVQGGKKRQINQFSEDGDSTEII